MQAWVEEMLDSGDSILAERQENLEAQLKFIKKHRERSSPRMKALKFLVKAVALLLPKDDDSDDDTLNI